VEEIAVVLIQGFLEFLLEFLFWFGIDLAWSRDNGWLGFGRIVVFLLLGGFLAFLLNHAHARLLMPTDALRVAMLVVGPLAAGFLAWLIARRRRDRGREIVPGNHFVTAFCFVLAFDLVRFAYGAR
jgi:hypothetical protein